MFNSIATYKESLSRIADGVLDATDEFEIPRSNSGSPVSASGRRIPRRSPRFASPDGSPVSNETDHSSQDDEIAKYRADIQKLQASEAQIKALSFNYAAILKEREEQLSKLLEENGSLRKSLDAKEAVAPLGSDGSVDHQRSRIRLQRNTSQENSWSASHSLKNSAFKQDRFSNGTSQATPFDAIEQKMESESANSLVNGKEHKNLLEEISSLESMRASHESEVKQLRDLLDNERENASTVKLKLQEEQTLNESSQKELQDLKIEKKRTFGEIKMFQKELSEKMSELRRLQAELSRRDVEEPNGSINNLDNLKKTITELEKENVKLQVEKNELEVNLELAMKTTPDQPHGGDRDPDRNKLDEVTEEMTLSMRKLEESLKDAYKERDKALQELARLKQHLLDKELEDSDKMDEDGKVIEELRVTSEHQKAYILQLEEALKQEVEKREDIENLKTDELQKSQETIKELTQNLANYMSIVDSKNIELQNLQMALGQYYAESEAKERLGRDFAAAREQIAKLSESFKVSNQALEMSRREKEDIISKHSQIERMFLEGNYTVQKLEEDNSKLRRALEQSMTTVNRMSLDSDNFVDRRIVIKLLVTYFQRNHSKEVLDLMVRMLGFTEEDKKRIGLAQSAAGKGVVRGVLGLPGRLVGGILGGSSPETSSQSPDNQSFADLWVDFLLKETVEREKRESEEAARMAASTSTPITNHGTNSPTNYTAQYSAQSPSSLPPRLYQPSEHSDAEFATVPLTSSVSPLADKGYPSSSPSY